MSNGDRQTSITWIFFYKLPLQSVMLGLGLGLGPEAHVLAFDLGLICSQSTSTYSSLEVSHFMRYKNLRLTYLLTCTLWPC